MLKFLFTLLASWSINSQAWEKPLSCFSVAQKLSMSILNKPASMQDIQECEENSKQGEKMTNFILNWMNKSKAKPEFLSTQENFFASWLEIPYGETTKLGAHLLKEGASINLLLEKDFIYLNQSLARPYKQLEVRTRGPLPALSDKPQRVYLDEDENRFRSFLSHVDFLNRYPDTETNRNRKRANYVFEKLLCETLAPTEPDANFPLLDNDDSHGSDPDCIGCHYRLDPLARFFDKWAPPYPMSEMVVYKPSASGQGTLIILDENDRRYYSGKGLMRLSSHVLSDPRFKRCVVNKLWDYLYAGTIALEDTDQEKLLQVFTQTDGNLMKLLEKAITHPYFWSHAEPRNLVFNDVKDSLKVCASCHKPDGHFEPRFNPKEYPFNQEPEENAKLLKKIYQTIRAVAGVKPMPPDPFPKVSKGKIKKIRTWISTGAQKNNKEKTLTSDQIKEVLRD